MFENVRDDSRILYEGNSERLPHYAVTVTSRTKYDDPVYFRTAFYEFLYRIGYKYGISAVMEYHKQNSTTDKVHAHGFIGSPKLPKGNKHNDFHLEIRKVTDIDGWVRYCLKDK